VQQLEQDLCLELLIDYLLWNNDSEQTRHGNSEVVKRRRRSEGKDGNGSMTVRQFVGSDNEIYLTSFKQITV
jgi:hypothetical protein